MQETPAEDIVHVKPPSEIMQKYMDDIGIMERGDAGKIISESWDDLLTKIPSKFSKEFDRVRHSFSCRQEYIAKFGYVLLTQEVLEDIRQITDLYKIEKFIELGSGTGFLTKALVDVGLAGTGYSLEIPKVVNKKKNAWGLEPTVMYDFCLKEGLLQIGDMREIINVPIPDMIVSAWVPYTSGQEVQEFFDTNGYPEWYLLIGEGRGGCTANDEFHDWLEEKYEVQETIDSYISFDGIYDDIQLHKRRDNART